MLMFMLIKEFSFHSMIVALTFSQKMLDYRKPNICTLQKAKAMCQLEWVVGKAGIGLLQPYPKLLDVLLSKFTVI